MKTKKAKVIRFKKLCKGLYVNHDWNFTLSHEIVWRKSEGRKWVAKWKESYMGFMELTERSCKFDTMKDARDFLREKAAR